MARIRTVKPELFKHDELYEAEIETGLPLRVAFIGLFTVCDREGRFRWRPRRLKVDILPYDEVDFSRVLHALTTRGFLVHYASITREARVDFGCIPSFKRHQVINNKESPSELPSFDDKGMEVVTHDYNEALDNKGEIHALATREPRVSHALTTRDYLDQGEGKGREGKGKEGNKEQGKEGVASDDACQTEVRPVRNDHSEQIQEVFFHWQTVMGHPQSKLDTKRKKFIRDALKLGYTVDQLKLAVVGCSKTDHNMGRGSDSNGNVYDGIHIIFKNADQIDRFIRNAHIVQSDMSQIGVSTQAAGAQVMEEMFGDNYGR